MKLIPALLLILASTPLFSNQLLPENMMSTPLEQSTWLPYVKKIAETHGSFETKDAFGNPVLLEWIKTSILSPELAAFKKTICPLACKEIAPLELQFLRTHPEAAPAELFLRSSAPLLENGVETADWKAIEEKIQATIEQFYHMDLSKFGPEMIKPLLNDVYLCMTIKNKEEDTLLGYLMCAVTPALPFGNIKVINLVVRSEEKDRGLEKVLMSSLFKLVPQTQRIFFFVRPTSKHALQTYHSLGFAEDLDLFQDPNHKVDTKYLTPLEYKSESSEILQKAASD